MAQRNRLSHSDYAAVFACVEAVHTCRTLDAFPAVVLAALRQLVNSHLAGYNEVNLKRNRVVAMVDPLHPAFAPLIGEFEKLMHQHPVIGYFDRTGDGQALKISDFLGARPYHALALYQKVYRPMEVEDQMAIGVKLEPGFMIGIAFARRERSFTERDRLKLNLVRPHLVQAYLRVAERADAAGQNEDLAAALRECGVGVITLDDSGGRVRATPAALECLHRYFPRMESKSSELPGSLAQWAIQNSSSEVDSPFIVAHKSSNLVVRRVRNEGRLLLVLSEERHTGEAAWLMRYDLTARELEVLKWLALGRSNPNIAAILGLSTGTVKLHVERVLAKLGVENRTAAALMARRAGF
jgi:DNA-binding CsgD family transcriptional regulator